MRNRRLFSMIAVLVMMSFMAGCDTMNSSSMMSIEEVEARITELVTNSDDAVAGKGGDYTFCVSDPITRAHLIDVVQGTNVYVFDILLCGYKTSYGMYADNAAGDELFEGGFNSDGVFSQFLGTVNVSTNLTGAMRISFTIPDSRHGFLTLTFYVEGGFANITLPKTPMSYHAVSGGFVAHGQRGGADEWVYPSFYLNPNQYSHRVTLPAETVKEAFGLQYGEYITLNTAIMLGDELIGVIDEYSFELNYSLSGVGVTRSDFSHVIVDGEKSGHGGLRGASERREFCQFVSYVDPEGVVNVTVAPGGCKG